MQRGLAYWVGSGYLGACVEGASYLSGLLSKTPAFFKVLSQRLHLIGQLLLVTWTFKLPSVLKTAGQFSHLNDFSPIHFVTWLVLLLYGIFFPQCLQLNSLWEFMGILNRLSHYHHAHFACASSDVFQKSCIQHNELWRLHIYSVGNDTLSVKCDIIFLPKRNLSG